MRNVVFVVAHPDDAACAVGGTILLMHGKFKVHILCATRGERGLSGLKSLQETAKIREAEERNAANLLKISSLTFLNRIDRELLPDEKTCQLVAEHLLSLTPVAVFTIWPVDSHPDHSAISEITRKALFYGKINPELYYFEEDMGLQTTRMQPDIHIDITDVIEQKLAAIRCHVCQNTEDRMTTEIQEQNRWRGRECGVRYAEVFQLPLPLTNRSRSILFEL